METATTGFHPSFFFKQCQRKNGDTAAWIPFLFILSKQVGNWSTASHTCGGSESEKVAERQGLSSHFTHWNSWPNARPSVHTVNGPALSVAVTVLE